MGNTNGLMILPETWLAVKRDKETPNVTRKEKLRIEFLSLFEDFLRFAKIREAGRVGSEKQISIKDIGSIVLLEDYTAQKRWYRCVVYFSAKGHKFYGKPADNLYFFADPWIIQRIMDRSSDMVYDH